jgi:hypothetical protein
MAETQLSRSSRGSITDAGRFWQQPEVQNDCQTRACEVRINSEWECVVKGDGGVESNNAGFGATIYEPLFVLSRYLENISY